MDWFIGYECNNFIRLNRLKLSPFNSIHVTIKPVSKRPKLVYQDQLLLNAGQKYCRMHSAILSTFIRLSFVIKIFVLSIFEWPFYTGFTVHLLTQQGPQLNAQGGTLFFSRIHRLGPSIYRSSPKNIRNFKHPQKIFEILATQKYPNSVP